MDLLKDINIEIKIINNKSCSPKNKYHMTTNL
jgi:hypothetical protein